MEDIYNEEKVGYFVRGALFWKFMKDGVMIAFYPVFGEVVFFYLLHQDLQSEIAQREQLGNTVETHTEVMRRKVPVNQSDDEEGDVT